jgi:hypothetical protein
MNKDVTITTEVWTYGPLEVIGSMTGVWSALVGFNAVLLSLCRRHFGQQWPREDGAGAGKGSGKVAGMLETVGM